MKRKQQIHRFKCPCGRVRFIRHKRGYFQFKHKDGSTCNVLSRFSSTLKKHFQPDMKRNPPKLHEVVSIFANMPEPAGNLFNDAERILGNTNAPPISLRTYLKQKRDENEKAKRAEVFKLESEQKKFIQNAETIERLAKSLMSNERRKKRERLEKIIQELVELQ